MNQTETILEELRQIDALLELQVYRGASLSPPGDVIKVAVPNSRLNNVMRLLDQHNLGKSNGVSLSSSDPDGIIPTQSVRAVERDNNEATWEEMLLTIGDDSNTTPNTLIAMFMSGVLATAGIATNALHIVIGGMLIAPGFMPITRVALGLVARSGTWRYGLLDFIKGYLSLIVGAIITAVVLKALGYSLLTGSPSYYTTVQSLADYWTTFTAPSLVASFAAGIAGGLLVASKKSVFTSGVMIGLALVPSAALVGVGLVEADISIALKALLRFAAETLLVLVTSLLVLGVMRVYLHKRDTVF